MNFVNVITYLGRSSGLVRVKMLGFWRNLWLFGLSLVAISFAHGQNLASNSASLVTEKSNRSWEGQWKFGLGGVTFSEGQDEGAAAYSRFTAKFEYRFTPWLNAFVLPQAEFYSSRVQERYDNGTYESKIRMREGYLRLHAQDFLELRAGAISLKDFADGEDTTGLLISGGRTFPGFQERAKWSSEMFEIGVITQQLVPTSYTLNTERDNQEPLPSFNSEMLYGAFNPNSKTKLSASFAHFSFAGLPDKVAFESAAMGNRVQGEIAPGSQFKSKFAGWTWGGVINSDFSEHVGISADYMGLVNTRAQASDRDGMIWGLGPRLIFKSWDMSALYGQYFLESDATVAYYTAPSLGHTNREGQYVQFIANFKESGFKVLGQWSQAKAIIENGVQKDFSEVFLRVETTYASF